MDSYVHPLCISTFPLLHQYNACHVQHACSCVLSFTLWRKSGPDVFKIRHGLCFELHAGTFSVPDSAVFIAVLMRQRMGPGRSGSAIA